MICGCDQRGIPGCEWQAAAKSQFQVGCVIDSEGELSRQFPGSIHGDVRAIAVNDGIQAIEDLHGPDGLRFVQSGSALQGQQGIRDFIGPDCGNVQRCTGGDG